jgi:hypothetical protein
MHRHALLLALSVVSGAVVHAVQRVPLTIFTDLGLNHEVIYRGSTQGRDFGVVAIKQPYATHYFHTALDRRLVGGRVGLSELVMFFSVLGGLRVFGVLGIVLGPVLFAIAAGILDVLSNETAMPGDAKIQSVDARS